MFTSFLRRRGLAFLAAGAAAAAVLALAAPAGASTGPQQTSPEQAGYTADHAQFKKVFADIYTPDPRQFAGMVARYARGIQLWSADRVVSLKFTASTAGETYTPSVTIYDRSTHQVIASDPNAKHRPYREDWSPGVGGPWGWSIYWTHLSIGYSPATGHLEMTVVDGPDLRPDIVWSYDLPGQSFTTARIGTEFGRSPWDTTYTYTPPAKPVKAASYAQVSLTSYSGRKADLSSVWWMRHKLLAQPQGRGLVATSHDLTNGGANFQTWFAPKGAQGSS